MKKRKPNEIFFQYLENLMDEHPWKTILIKTITSAILILVAAHFSYLPGIICFSAFYIGFIIVFIGFIF